MKKIIRLLTIILVFYLIFNYFLGKGNDPIQYKIKDFSIREIHDKDTYFEVNINGLEFNFWVFNDLNKKSITNIKYYTDDEYKCIFPIFKDNKTYIDIICLKNGVQYLYNTIDNIPEKLIEFRKEQDYYSETTDEISHLDMLTIYKNNLLEDKYLIINSYKGIYILNKNSQKEVTLFEKDIYNPSIKYLLDKYYIIADYNQEHDFSSFFIVDIETGKKSTLKTKYSISLDSIIQGVYEDNLYLYDNDSKIQYKINPKKMSITIAGTEKKGIKIYNGELATYKINEIKDFKFKKETLIEKYNLLGTTENTYYYSLNKNIYKAHKNNINKLTYLFKNNYEIVKYDKDYLCMLENDTIYCYNELKGIKKIVTNKELTFNKNLTYELYSK